MSGFIKLFRSILINPDWIEKPFDKSHAWVDLLLLANHEDNEIANRGEVVKTNDFFQNRWGWGNTKLRNFFQSLSEKSQIKLKTTKKQTKISIVRYSDYQNEQTKNKPKTNQKQTNAKYNIIKEERIENKEGILKEEIIKEEKKYGHVVELTDEEYEKLVATFTKQKVDDKIEDMNEYCVNNKKRYASYYLALNKWLKKDSGTKQVSKAVEKIQDFYNRYKEIHD